ncbi:MAG: acyl-CoA synthetase [Burkholderiaceae bacterium]|jgi:predicted LPLAT superfamily acyltransferase|nr:acyl-CoA synthetase [Burkholderiaceae bacterium]
MKPSSSHWKNRPERSFAPVVRFMVWLSLTLGRRASRLVLHLIVLYFLFFAPAARRASKDYLRRALGRRLSVRDGYRHVLGFASMIHDRVYWLSGRTDLFDVTITGDQGVIELAASGRGIVFLGAHFGSFEALRALGERHAFDVKMLMYPDNARLITTALAAIDPRMLDKIIVLGQPESILRVRDHLATGGAVGILGDRALADDKSRALPFLGGTALFPTSPLRLAAMLRAPVVFMAGSYLGGNRYHLSFAPVADFAEVTAGQKDACIDQALQRYTALLEQHCLQAPYNWFNFYDFWKPAPKP